MKVRLTALVFSGFSLIAGCGENAVRSAGSEATSVEAEKPTDLRALSTPSAKSVVSSGTSLTGEKASAETIAKMQSSTTLPLKSQTLTTAVSQPQPSAPTGVQSSGAAVTGQVNSPVTAPVTAVVSEPLKQVAPVAEQKSSNAVETTAAKTSAADALTANSLVPDALENNDPFEDFSEVSEPAFPELPLNSETQSYPDAIVAIESEPLEQHVNPAATQQLEATVQNLAVQLTGVGSGVTPSEPSVAPSASVTPEPAIPEAQSPEPLKNPFASSMEKAPVAQVSGGPHSMAQAKENCAKIIGVQDFDVETYSLTGNRDITLKADKVTLIRFDKNNSKVTVTLKSDGGLIPGVCYFMDSNATQAVVKVESGSIGQIYYHSQSNKSSTQITVSSRAEVFKSDVKMSGNQSTFVLTGTGSPGCSDFKKSVTGSNSIALCKVSSN